MSGVGVVIIGILPVLFPVLIGGAAVAISVVNSRKVAEAWTAAGERLGFDTKIGGMFDLPKLAGTHKGLPVVVDVNVTGSGDSKSKDTRYTVRHAPVGPSMTLRREATFSFIRKLAGHQDVQVGDPFFDERVMVDSEASPGELAEFLNPARRAAVLDLFAKYRRAEISNGRVVAHGSGIENDAATIVANVEWLVDVARLLQDPAAVDQALQRQLDGDLGGAVEELHAFNESEPNVFTTLLEAEALLESGDHGQATELLTGLDRQVPGDPSIQGWLEVARTPPPPPPPPPPEVADVAEEPASSPETVRTDLDQASTIADLFERGRMSWELTERFEQEYLHARVSWQGPVTSSRTYRYDTDFGEGPGVRATVNLGSVGESDYVSSQIDAVLQLPEGTQLQRGEVVRFVGVLVHVDRFSRKIWIEQARLVEPT